MVDAILVGWLLGAFLTALGFLSLWKLALTVSCLHPEALEIAFFNPFQSNVNDFVFHVFL